MNSSTENSVKIAGLNVSRLSMLQHKNLIVSQSITGVITTLNLEMIYGLKDREYAEILKQSKLIIADGMPVVWASKLKNNPIAGRSNGTDLLIELLLNIDPAKIFVVGGSNVENALKSLSLNSNMLSGIATGEINFDFNPKQFENELNKSYLAIIALGVPKQDVVAMNIAKTYPHLCVISVGGAFDFISKSKPRAPKFMQNIGMEWLFRLATEPKRLWRRYVMKYPSASYILIKDVFFESREL